MPAESRATADVTGRALTAAALVVLLLAALLGRLAVAAGLVLAVIGLWGVVSRPRARRWYGTTAALGLLAVAVVLGAPVLTPPAGDGSVGVTTSVAPTSSSAPVAPPTSSSAPLASSTPAASQTTAPSSKGPTTLQGPDGPTPKGGPVTELTPPPAKGTVTVGPPTPTT